MSEIRRSGSAWMGKAARGARRAGQAVARARKQEAIASSKQTVKDASDAAIEYGRDLYRRKLGENEAGILSNCPVVAEIKGHRTAFESDPKVFGLLYNVRVRPILTAAVLGSTGGASVAFDEVLSRITRHVFDGDQLMGGWAAQRISSLVGGESAKAVNLFMDTVPGNTVPGGGWLHRIQHGHDLAALTQIAGDHGTGGVVQGLYHIYGRDFFTPAGIPILPVGSVRASEWLVGLGLGPEQAADLLSINFLELMGGLMAVLSLARILRLAKALRDNSVVRALVKRSEDAADQRDYVTAIALLHDARSLRPRDGALSLALGTINQRAGNRLEAYLAFRDATVQMAREEPTISLGGAVLSLRGMAAGMALSMTDALARSEQHSASWLDHVTGLGRAGITALETVGHRLIDRRFVKRFGRLSLLPPRHLSAALNFYLAGKLAGSSMFLSDRDLILARAYRRIATALTKLETRPTLSSRIDEVQFLHRFIAAEFLPPPVAA